MKKNNLKITFSLIFLVSFMFFLTFAAVPLYKLFCQVTGYGGTPKIVNVKDPINVSEKKIKIEFTGLIMIKKFSDEDLKKRKAKNIALLIILVVLVLIFYVMTWIRL